MGLFLPVWWMKSVDGNDHELKKKIQWNVVAWGSGGE
jgi:hypothetical protein